MKNTPVSKTNPKRVEVDEQKVQRPDFRIKHDKPIADEVTGVTPGYVYPSNKLFFKLDLPTNLPEDKVNQLKQYWDVERVQKSGEWGHPYLAVTRGIIEAMAIDIIIKDAKVNSLHYGPIVDAGGNGIRHLEHHRKFIHSCNPDLSKLPVLKGNCCPNTIDKCLTTCFPMSVGASLDVSWPVCTFSVHAWYYFTDDEKAALVENDLGCHYAVVHDFTVMKFVSDNENVPLCDGELIAYKIDDLIVCRAIGNTTTYRHNPCFELFTADAKKFGQTTLQWEVVKRVGSHILLKISKTTKEPEEIKIEPPVVINSHVYTTEVTQIASMFIGGVDRKTKTTLRSFNMTFPEYLRKSMKTLPNYPMQVICTDMYYYLDLEKKDLQENVTKDFLKSMNVIDKLRNMQIPDIPILSPIIESAIIGLGAYKIIEKKYRLVSLLVSLSWMAVRLYMKCTKDGVKTFAELIRRIQFMSFLKSKHMAKVRDICAPEELPTPDPKAIIKKPVMKEFCEPKRISQCALPYFSTSLPIRVRNCDHMVATAIYGRVVPDLHEEIEWTPDMIPEDLEYHCKNSFSQLMDVQYEKWLQRWPGMKRDMHLNQVKAGQLMERVVKFRKRRGFLKDEHYINKLTYAARMIQSSDPCFLDIVGPWIYAYSEKFCMVYNMENDDFFYATKTSAEATGSWYQRQLDLLRFVYKQDWRRYDSRLILSALEVEQLLYEMSGLPQFVLDAMKLHLNTDCNVGGWVIHCPGRRDSGGSNTAIGNSQLNYIVTKHITSKLMAIKMSFMANGDDGAQATDEPLDTEKFAELALRYGMEVDLHLTTPLNFEFCSGIMYPTKDGRVLGAKITRVLVKLFWDKKNLPFNKYCQWVGEVALGLRESVSFIPILSPYFEKLIELLRPEKAYRDEYHIYAATKHEMTQETIEFVCARYNITETDIRQCTQMLCDAVDTGDLLDLSTDLTFSRMCEVDNGVAKPHGVDHDGLFTIVPLNWKVHLLRVLKFVAARRIDFYFLRTLRTLMTCGVAPIMEEHGKRAFGRWAIPASFILGLFEDMMCQTFPSHTLLHVIMTCLPLKTGIILHLVNNLLATRNEYLRDKYENFFPASYSSMPKTNNAKQKKSKRRGQQIIVAPPRLVVQQPKKKKNTKNKQRYNFSPYMFARVSPFANQADGAKFPDTYSFPTGVFKSHAAAAYTATLTNCNAVVYSVFEEFFTANAPTVASGSVTWTGASPGAGPSNANFDVIAAMYRPVGGGLRITTDTSLTTSNGHIWIVHAPMDAVNSGTYLASLPTTEAQCAQYPLSEKYSLTQLAEQPLVIPFRPMSEYITQFVPTYNGASISGSPGTNNAMQDRGWCSIVIFSPPASGNATILSVERVVHHEYLPNPNATYYGFGAAVCEPCNLKELEMVANMGQVTPLGTFEGKEPDDVGLLQQVQSAATHFTASVLTSRVVQNAAASRVASFLQPRHRVYDNSYLLAHDEYKRLEF